MTIQQFIDVYMKKTKPISKRAETVEVEKPKTPPIQPDLNDEPDSFNEISESENDSLGEESCVTAKTNKNDGKEQKCDNNAPDDEDKITFDIMDEVCILATVFFFLNTYTLFSAIR